MTDRASPGAQGSKLKNVEFGEATGSDTEPFIVRSSEPSLAAQRYGELDESQFSEFDANFSASSLDVTVQPGEAYVSGWLATDAPKTVTLPTFETHKIILGWDADSVYSPDVHDDREEADRVVVKRESDLTVNIPYIVIWEFETDGNGVISSTDKRPVGENGTLSNPHSGEYHEDIAVGGVPVIDATYFGVSPDDGTDDSGALRDALDEAESRGGGVVRLPPGDVVLDSDPDFGRSNVHVKGQGEGITRLLVNSHISTGVVADPSRSDVPSQLEVSDLTLVMSSGQDSLNWASEDSEFHDLEITGSCNGNALFFSNYWDCTFENVDVHDISDIGSNGVWDITPFNVTVRDATGENLNQTTLLWPSGGSDFSAVNCEDEFRVVGGESTTDGVTVTRCRSPSISLSNHRDITVERCHTDYIGVPGAVDYTVESNIVHRSALGVGIGVSTTGGGTVHDNTLVNAQIDVSEISASEDCRYSDNRLRFPDTSPAAQVLNSSSSGVQDIVFSDNDFADGVAQFDNGTGIQFKRGAVEKLFLGMNGAEMRVNSDGDVEVVDEDDNVTVLT
jgi:hypothetical protein